MQVQLVKQILATKLLHQLHRQAYPTSGPIFATPETGFPAFSQINKRRGILLHLEILTAVDCFESNG